MAGDFTPYVQPCFVFTIFGYFHETPFKNWEYNQFGDLNMWTNIMAGYTYEKNVPKEIAKFTGKHLCQSLFF